ncbi:MAG: hypothetical protein U0168_27585 [Nannocystaceae bacterium]
MTAKSCNADAVGVGARDHLAQRLGPADTRVDLAPGDGPVAVVAGDQVHAVARGTGPRGWCGTRRGDPDRAHAQGVERAVVDRRAQALQVATEEVAARVGAGRGSGSLPPLPLLEAIGHDHIDHGVAPVERLGLDQNGSRSGSPRRPPRSAACNEGVLAVAEARQRERDRAGVGVDRELVGIQRALVEVVAQARHERRRLGPSPGAPST